MQMLRYLLTGLLLMTAGLAHAAQTQARLILSHDTARPGETIFAGIHLHMNKGWHTYWRNGGDSGKGTEVRWTLPPGLTAGAIQWPVPIKDTSNDLTSYVYANDAVLLVPLTIKPDAAPGEITLKANVAWLECETLCVPGKADVEAKLTVGPASKPSADAPQIEAAKRKLPLHTQISARAWWDRTASDSRPLVIEWTPVRTADGADFYPYENDTLEVSGETKTLTASAGAIRIRKTVKKLEGDWPKEMPGLLIEKTEGSDALGYEVRLAIGPKPQSATSASPSVEPSTANASAKPSRSLLLMLGFAFLGGLILNIMPCVLPVISLKILSFVKQSREAPAQVRKLGLVYVLGVILSFLALAGIIIAVQQARGTASWGMQFQNLTFLIAMTILVVLVALNLFGVFEVNLGGRVMGAAGDLASQGGTSGAFFNGILATALATPCTAPFLAPALGFAFAQPPAIILLMFLAIGIGLAAPYLLLSFKPGWLQFLPRPGPWMEKFKIIMGFPMLGTAFWLFTLSANHLGKKGSFWFGVFLVVLALAAWLWGAFVQRGGARPALVGAICAVLVGGTGAYALQQRAEEGWLPWSSEAVAKARADRRLILVDFTADWCATCQWNKKTSLEVPDVKAKLKDLNVLTFIGDFTREDPLIAAELKRFDRAGVPLVLVYPKNPDAAPIVLPEILTKSTVLDALDKAAKLQ